MVSDLRRDEASNAHHHRHQQHGARDGGSAPLRRLRDQNAAPPEGSEIGIQQDTSAPRIALTALNTHIRSRRHPQKSVPVITRFRSGDQEGDAGIIGRQEGALCE